LRCNAAKCLACWSERIRKSTTIKSSWSVCIQASGELNGAGSFAARCTCQGAPWLFARKNPISIPIWTPDETLDFYGRLFDMDSHPPTTRGTIAGDARAATMPGGGPWANFPRGWRGVLVWRSGASLINDPDLIVWMNPPPVSTRSVADSQRFDRDTGRARRRRSSSSSPKLADVEDVCHRVAILYNGRIQAMGRFRACWRTPANAA